MVDDLRPGTHTVTLTAKDRSGAEGTSEITISIEDGPGRARPSKEDEKLLLQGLGAPTGDDSNMLWYVAGGAAAVLVAALGGAAVWAARRRA